MQVGDLVIHRPSGAIGIITYIFPSASVPTAEVDFVCDDSRYGKEGKEIIKIKYIEAYNEGG